MGDGPDARPRRTGFGVWKQPSASLVLAIITAVLAGVTAVVVTLAGPVWVRILLAIVTVVVAVAAAIKKYREEQQKKAKEEAKEAAAAAEAEAKWLRGARLPAGMAAAEGGGRRPLPGGLFRRPLVSVS